MAVRYCPHCSHEVPAAARFCPKCAATLTPSPSLMPGAEPGLAQAPTAVDWVARNARRALIFAAFAAVCVLAFVVAMLSYKLKHPPPPPPPLLAVLAPPSNLTSTDITGGSVSLSWAASTSASVTAYSVYNGSTLAATVSDTTARITGLAPNSSFTFTVVAKDAEGNASQPSDPITIMTGVTPQITAPGNLTLTSQTSTSVSLSWTPVADDANVTGYDVYEGSTLATTISGASSAEATIQNLTPNTAYTFTVKARDAAGDASPASNPVTTTTSQSDFSGAPAETNTQPAPNPDGTTGVPDAVTTAGASDLPHPATPVNPPAPSGATTTP